MSPRLILYTTKFILIGIPITIVFSALNERFALTGKLTHDYTFRHPSPWITVLPQNYLHETEKNLEQRQTYKRILQEPLTVEVKLPIQTRTLRLDIEYQNPGAPIFDLGFQKKQSEGQGYNFEPIENKIIEQNDWIRTEDLAKNLLLFERSTQISEKSTEEKSPRYKTVDEFLNHLPLGTTIAVHHYDLSKHWRIPNYHPASQPRTLNLPLRGEHEIITYIENENLDFTLSYRQKKIRKNQKPFRVNLFYGEESIARFESPTDPHRSSNKSQGESLRVFAQNLSPGIYRLIIDVDENILIEKIATIQTLVGFQNLISLSDSEKPSRFFVESPFISFKTSHETGFQEISINKKKKVKINKIHTNILKDKLTDLSEISIPKSDIKMNYHGIATLDKESLKILKIPVIPLDDGSLNNPDIDFILSKYYKTVQEKDGWKFFSKTFNLKDLWIENQNVKFSLSIPGSPRFENIKLRKIRMILER